MLRRQAQQIELAVRCAACGPVLKLYAQVHTVAVPPCFNPRPLNKQMKRLLTGEVSHRCFVEWLHGNPASVEVCEHGVDVLLVLGEPKGLVAGIGYV